MTRRAGTSRRGADGADALVAEFVDSWRGLSGDAWIVGGGRDDVRRTIGEAVTEMAGAAWPEARRRVIAWATADLESLDLPALLAELGCEYVAWPSGHPAAGDPGNRPQPIGARDGRPDVAQADPAAANLVTQAATCDLGLTTCSWAVAETGTIALYASSTAGRLPSLLPTAHLALVRPSQIVKAIADGLRLLADNIAEHDGPPSAVNLVSGPSRSADIEGDVAVGVHGPRRAGVIVADW